MTCLPVAATPSAKRGGRRSLWTVALFALALSLGACEMIALAAADRVPHLTVNQQKRAVTTIINHHSFSPPLLRQYYGDGEIPHWHMSGTTVVTDNYVRLTADQESQTGHLWNTEPLDMDAFEVTFGFRAFRIMGGIGADGLALWVAQPPRVDGNIFGRPANFNGFGILFDSYDNDNRRDNPMVSLVSNDGSANYKLTPDTDFMGQTLAHCIFDFRNILAPNMATARLRYKQGTLSLYLSRNSEVDEQHCFTVSNLPMPVGKSFLAFSGQTGGVSETHDLIFVHLSPIEGERYERDVHEPTADDEGEAELYNNDAMVNRHTAETTTETAAPTETPTPPPTQSPEDIEERIRAEAERRVAAMERQRLEAELLRQQQQQQQQQTTTSTIDPVEADRRRIAELERRIADLKRQQQQQQQQQTPTEYDEEEYEYEDEAPNQPPPRRVRRARTPRRNTPDNNE